MNQVVCFSAKFDNEGAPIRREWSVVFRSKEGKVFVGRWYWSNPRTNEPRVEWEVHNLDKVFLEGIGVSAKYRPDFYVTKAWILTLVDEINDKTYFIPRRQSNSSPIQKLLEQQALSELRELPTFSHVMGLPHQINEGIVYGTSDGVSAYEQRLLSAKGLIKILRDGGEVRVTSNGWLGVMSGVWKGEQADGDLVAIRRTWWMVDRQGNPHFRDLAFSSIGALDQISALIVGHALPPWLTNDSKGNSLVVSKGPAEEAGYFDALVVCYKNNSYDAPASLSLIVPFGEEASPTATGQPQIHSELARLIAVQWKRASNLPQHISDAFPEPPRQRSRIATWLSRRAGNAAKPGGRAARGGDTPGSPRR
jgi:hypothetical protein